MRTPWWVVLLVPACEQASVAEHAPPPAPAIAPPKAEPKVAPPPVYDDDVGADRDFAPPTPTPVEDGLPPSPITDRTVYDPPAYERWLAKLTPKQRARVDQICREDKTGFRPECDGIGSLHIPVPPDLKPFQRPPGYTAFASESEWEFVITPQMDRYIKQNCYKGESTGTSDLCGTNTPLVVTFDGTIDFTRRARFAFSPGHPLDTAWPSAPWLALDRDGNGTIDSGAELFGNHTLLADGRLARGGFESLAALDANRDGVIDDADPDFAKLVLWGDAITPASAQIQSISLASTLELRCDEARNCEGERASVKLRDGRTATIVDVYIPQVTSK
jgi:hypothetical protein